MFGGFRAVPVGSACSALIGGSCCDGCSKGRPFVGPRRAVPAKYYLRAETTPEQWTSTYFIDYADRSGERLNGERGYLAALSDGYFDVIVLNWTVTKELDDSLVRHLRTNDKYRMLGRIPYQTSYGKGHYEIWVKAQTM